MSYTVGNAGATQNPAATNSVSTAQSNPSYCGTYVWSIVETISGVSIDSATGLITVSSNSLAAVGVKTATIQVGLSSYTDVAKV